MKKKEILFVGGAGVGKLALLDLAITNIPNNVHIVHDVLDNTPTELIAQEPLEYTMPKPLLEKTWVDPNKPVFNYRKHKASCDKNRKKRKKIKRK